MARSSVRFACAALLLACAWSAAASGAGKVRCQITENGQPASGMVSVQRDGTEIASGNCAKEITVPDGQYTAALRLDGALDGPEQKQPLVVTAGASVTLKGDFATGILTVRIASQGKRAAGLAIIKRNGQQLGTLGSGVAAHLSAGSYRVLARYRTQEKDLGEINLGAGQQITLEADFE